MGKYSRTNVVKPKSLALLNAQSNEYIEMHHSSIKVFFLILRSSMDYPLIKNIFIINFCKSNFCYRTYKINKCNYTNILLFLFLIFPLEQIMYNVQKIPILKHCMQLDNNFFAKVINFKQICKLNILIKYSSTYLSCFCLLMNNVYWKYKGMCVHFFV